MFTIIFSVAVFVRLTLAFHSNENLTLMEESITKFNDVSLYTSYVVSVRVRIPKPFGIKASEHLCGGTILNKNRILTAAHCFFYIDRKGKCHGIPHRLIYVIQDSQNLYDLENAFIVNIAKINIHPKFIPEERINDIAVLTSSEEFNLGDTVHLPSRSPVISDPGIISGFGRLYPGGPFSGFVLYEFVLIGNCEEMLLDNLLEATFCAMNFETPRGGVCKGGSGGGLITPNFEIVGILSKGSICGGQGKPAIYTEVYSHKLWIQQVLNNALKNLISKTICTIPLLCSLIF